MQENGADINSKTIFFGKTIYDLLASKKDGFLQKLSAQFTPNAINEMVKQKQVERLNRTKNQHIVLVFGRLCAFYGRFITDNIITTLSSTQRERTTQIKRKASGLSTSATTTIVKEKLTKKYKLDT